jgi:toxin FitB
MAVTAITVMEIRYGIACQPEEARKGALEAKFRQFLARGFAGRVLPFDEAAEPCAALRAQRRRLGQAFGTEDSMIAGIALQRGATVATRDRGFTGCGVPVIDPWGTA